MRSPVTATALAKRSGAGSATSGCTRSSTTTPATPTALRKLLLAHGIEHRFIRPRRPQTNGKVERYQQTLKREWGLGRVYRSSNHRAQPLSHWLHYYNTRRPHSSLDGRPPNSRVHNLPRQDT